MARNFFPPVGRNFTERYLALSRVCVSFEREGGTSVCDCPLRRMAFFSLIEKSEIRFLTVKRYFV